VENKEEQKDWERKFIKRLKRGGMDGISAQILFLETYGNGYKIDLGENPEQAAQILLLRRLSGKGE